MNRTKRVLLAFLIVIFVLITPVTVQASMVGGAATGDSESRTYIHEPGSAQSADELKELNIGNNLTVTYNDGNGTIAGSLRILLILTGIALAPILIILLTSFTRILIVLHFTRTALNTQTAPPNQVLIGIALFLTYFIMSPIITQINETAVKPFEAGEITQEEALEIGMEPLREFMFKQTQKKDARMFTDIAGKEWTGKLEDIDNSVLIPSFIVSELRTAFIIGFVIYIPFIVIDMVVASALMSMGMMMLPPTTISMPFKILLFVLADGWNLVIVNLVKTFY
ncbi:MAG: flagellar type III secretion system pore protein FliP [Lachnospiraceae bacterium]|nr:flagellar type III secretion system pore protein FliP [Lachnospiraceae bacterium]